MVSGRYVGHRRAQTLDPDEARERCPDGLYVLTVPVDGGERVEVWELQGGSTAIVGFSSVTELVAACGAGQPFRHIDADEIEHVCFVSATETVVINTPIPVEPRYPDVDVVEAPELAVPSEPDQGSTPLAYLPSRPSYPGDAQVGLELQPYGGRLALLVYTSPEALEQGCGPHQAWIAVHPDDLDLVAAQAGANQMLFNPTLADESRHDRPVVDWSRRRKEK